MKNSPLVQREFKVWSPFLIHPLPSMVMVLRNPLFAFYPSFIVAFSGRGRVECFTSSSLQPDHTLHFKDLFYNYKINTYAL